MSGGGQILPPHVFSFILVTAFRGIFSLQMRKLVKLFAEDSITGKCWRKDLVSDFFGPNAQALFKFYRAVFWVEIGCYRSSNTNMVGKEIIPL